MYRFLETIKLLDGNFYRLPLHQQRLNKAFSECFPKNQAPNLISIIQNSDFPLNGLFKCRILFDEYDLKIEFEPYVRKKISSLQLMNTDIQTFNYKPADRIAYQQAFNLRKNCDDVLLVRDEFITDTSFTNIAFFDGTNWITPEIPLIYGVNRASLLAEQKIVALPVKISDLSNFKFFRLFNAMIEFGEIELSMTAINQYCV
jgi:4-amino-4-deoxychorismate lyase